MVLTISSNVLFKDFDLLGTEFQILLTVRSLISLRKHRLIGPTYRMAHNGTGETNRECQFTTVGQFDGGKQRRRGSRNEKWDQVGHLGFY
jgi:hypothetical protein